MTHCVGKVKHLSLLYQSNIGTSGTRTGMLPHPEFEMQQKSQPA